MELVIKNPDNAPDTRFGLFPGSGIINCEVFNVRWENHSLRIESKGGAPFLAVHLPAKMGDAVRVEVDRVNVPHVDVAKKRKREEDKAEQERISKVARTSVQTAPVKEGMTEEERLRREAKNKRAREARERRKEKVESFTVL
jgi:hypothetical protein